MSVNMFGDNYALVMICGGFILISLALLRKMLLDKNGNSIAAIYTGIIVMIAGLVTSSALNYISVKIGKWGALSVCIGIFIVSSVGCFYWARKEAQKKIDNVKNI